ncbi:MAG: DUF2169 domain-containing protein [Myxococcales bacterium]|nr:DUF2169 domain-containing protein [Myxococcales bacterium]
MRLPPPIVARVDPARLFGRRVARFPVGVVPWRTEQERSTVVVKLSYDFDPAARHAEPVLVDPRPFSIATPSEIQGALADELAAPDDLVRAKRGTDLLVFGELFADRPVERVTGQIHVRDRAMIPMVAVGTAGRSFPLAGGFLRTEDGTTPLVVGPSGPRVVLEEEPAAALEEMTPEEKKAAYQETLAMIYGGEFRSWKEALATPLSEGEEEGASEREEEDELEGWDTLADASILDLAECHHYASPALTLDTLDEDHHIEAQSVRPNGESTHLQLPGHRPVVVFEAPEQTFDVAMYLDTVSVDFSRGALDLVFRGQIPVDAFAFDEQRVIVMIAHVDDVPSLQAMLDELPRGDFTRAEVPDQRLVEEDQRVPDSPPLEDDVDLQTAKQMASGPVPDPVLSLDDFVTLAGALAAAPDERARLLSARDLDAEEWALEERGWRKRVGAALAAGDLDLVAAFNKRMRQARDAALAAHVVKRRET